MRALHTGPLGLAIVITAALAGCSQQPAQSARGYGIPAVPGDTLAGMEAMCAANSGAANSGAANSGAANLDTPACDQLRRSVVNQPGNAVGPAGR